MNDDWRVQVEFRDESHLRLLLDRFEGGLEHELSSAFADRVIVGREGAVIFLYAGTREQAEAARDVVHRLAGEHGWEVDAELRHWHPEAEEWEDPDDPLPGNDAARKAEHEELIAKERRETEERRYPEFEVRVNLGTHHEAAEFAQRLRGEGIPCVQRWKYLLVGATDEDAAKALAERIETEAPADSSVRIEGTWKLVYDEQPPNPYAIFGGLGV